MYRADTDHLTMRLVLIPALLLLAACGDKPGLFSRPDTAAADGPYAAIRPGPRPGDGPEDGAAAGTPQTEAEVAPAERPAEPTSGPLGTTIASLGNAAEPGLWLKTPLVQTEGPGKVSYSGKEVEARLIPIDGPLTAGSRASLQLMQALGAPLTGLPEVSVSR